MGRSKPCTPKALRRLSSTCANLSHPAQTIWRLQTPLQPLVQLQWDQLAETWRYRTLPESHRSLDVHKSLPEAQQNQGIPLSVQASSHSRPASGALGSYDSETYQVPDGVKIKDEPDDHLSLSGSDYGSEGMKSPPMNTTGMSPIDMETQERSNWTESDKGTDWRPQSAGRGSWSAFPSLTTECLP